MPSHLTTSFFSAVASYHATSTIADYLERDGIDAATPVVPPSAYALASPSPVLQPEIPSSAPLLATAPDEAATSRFRALLTKLELNQLLKIESC